MDEWVSIFDEQLGTGKIINPRDLDNIDAVRDLYKKQGKKNKPKKKGRGMGK